MTEKLCNRCGQVRPFYKNKNRSDGLTVYCSVCMRALHEDWKARNPAKAKAATKRWRKANPERDTKNKLEWARNNPEKVRAGHQRMRLKRYGLSEQDWLDLLADQKGLCGVCSQPMDLTGRGANSAAVDHDHATGRVRALLHNSCNQAIGIMNEDPVRLRMAAEYLEKMYALPPIHCSPADAHVALIDDGSAGT